MIRLPAHAATLQKKLLQAADEFREHMGAEPTEKELLELVDASENVVKATMFSGRNVISLNQATSSDPDSATLEDKIEDPEEHSSPFFNVASKELMDIVSNVLTSLSEKESAILRLRFGLFEEEENKESYLLSEEEISNIKLGISLQ